MSAKTKLKIKSLAFIIVDLPVVRNIYQSIYNIKIRKAVSKMPNTINVETINCCNLKCVMCAYPTMTRPVTVMPQEAFIKAINQARELGINNINLTCYNESFMDPILFERLRYARSKGIEVTFSSNGTLVTPDIIQQVLKDPPTRIIFSFDAFTKETYESIRIGADFEKTRSNILHLIEERNRHGLKEPIIEVNFLLMNNNYQELKDFQSFWGGKVDHMLIGSIHNQFTDKYDFKGIKTQSKYPYPCARAFNNWAVLSNGNVTFCACQDLNGKFIVGNINKNTIAEIYNSSAFKEIRSKHLSYKGNEVALCRKCTFLYKSVVNWWVA